MPFDNYYNISLNNSNIDYDYPQGLDLRPGSDLHKSILSKIMEKVYDSSQVMVQRHKLWRKTDKILTVYKDVSEEEKEVKKKDHRKPISMVFPYSYAILETLLSYMTVAFFRDPIFRYEGVGPDDVIGAILLEKVINLHVNKFKIPLNLHTMFKDAFAYGLAPILPIWERDARGIYEGNALTNIDPYLYLPDTNVSASDIQKGEFVSWVNHTNYLNLLEEENINENVFNVKYLKRHKNRVTSIFSGDLSNRNLKTGMNDYNTFDNLSRNRIDEIHIYIKLIPSEWKLGDSEVPEKWFFRIAADNYIITARPADFEHNKFPVTVCVPDYDGYSAAPISRIEILSELQGLLDFLLNSHMTNVRKAINDMFVFDPSIMNTNDLTDPEPGKLIRIRRNYFGKGKIDEAIKQFPVNDITRANINDSNWVAQLMQKASATDDAAMGVLRNTGPERLTGAEFKGTQQGAVSRLERLAYIISVQTMKDLGEFFAEHTKQMMSNDVFVKIAGENIDILLEEFGKNQDRGRLSISPDQINVFYDIIVSDGSVPNVGRSEIILRFFQIIAADPDLRKTFDIVRMFKTMVRETGLKNVNDYVRVMPDEEVQRQQEAGNLVAQERI